MIDNKKISNFAISIVEKLNKNNFEAYLVGGCVRDLLCGLSPKDFDIATSATPIEIKKIFKASRIIGKRFKLVHIFDRSELIEVATFRSGETTDNDSNLVKDESGKIIDDGSDLIPLMTSDDEEAINKEKLPKSLSILPLKNTVLFPGVVIPIIK